MASSLTRGLCSRFATSIHQCPRGPLASLLSLSRLSSTAAQVDFADPHQSALQNRKNEAVDPDLFLRRALRKEHIKASEAVEKCKKEAIRSFAPFELVHTEGTSDLTLLRRIGDEEIIVKCLLQIEEPEDIEYLLEDDDDNLNIIRHLNLNIQIKKASLPDKRLQLLCHYTTEAVFIKEIVFMAKSTYIENDYPYSGPLFSEMSEKLQGAFYEILYERGINPQLADLAMDHLTSKYRVEYLRWIQNIRSFVKKKFTGDGTGSMPNQF